jgi:hypothetical protein
MHSGHDGHPRVEQQPDDLVPVVRQLPDEGAGVLGVAEGLHIPADAEPRPVAEQQDRSGLVRPLREVSGRSSVIRQTSPSTSVSTCGRSRAWGVAWVIVVLSHQWLIPSP